jgi:hypothetical protein
MSKRRPDYRPAGFFLAMTMTCFHCKRAMHVRGPAKETAKKLEQAGWEPIAVGPDPSKWGKDTPSTVKDRHIVLCGRCVKDDLVRKAAIQAGRDAGFRTADDVTPPSDAQT